MDTLLVPLDGSERSEQALPYAALFARLLEASVRLFHVVTEHEQQSYAAQQEQLRELYLPHWRTGPIGLATRRHDETYLERHVRGLHAEGVAASTEVAFGEPVDAIVEAARWPEVAMIVMSTHGRGSLGRWLVGSVAHKVLRLTACPLLAVRAPASQPPALRRILVPLDGSERAREALPVAAELARKAGASLVLLTVLAPQFGLDPGIALAPGEAHLRTLRERVLVELQGIAAEHRDLEMAPALGEGFAGPTICREAERHGADLIVMAAHGHGGPHPFGLGSVTDKVLHATTVPVLVTHGRPDEQKPAVTGAEAAGAEPFTAARP